MTDATRPRRPSLSWALVALSLARCAASAAPNDSAADAQTEASSADALARDASEHAEASADTGVTIDASADRDAPRDAVVDARPEGGDAASTPDASTAADVTSDATTLSGPSCDGRRVLCERVPPVCATGEAPSVVGSCWGPCVAATTCACTSDEECPDVRGFSEICYPRQMRCGPLL